MMLRALKRGFIEPRLYIFLLSSIMLWFAAFQYKTSYVIDLGGLDDDAYVQGFHEKEVSPAFSFRWTRGDGLVTFPGLGNEPAILTLTGAGGRPDGSAVPVDVEARGHIYHSILSGASTLTFYIERGADKFDGDLQVAIASPQFSPSGDMRELGVVVDTVEVIPAEYGLRPVVIPPLWEVFALALSVLLVYLAVTVSLRRSGPALASACLLGAAYALLIVFARLELGLFAPLAVPLAALLFTAAAFGTATLALAGRERRGLSAGIAGLAFAGALVFRLGGTVYPQFLTSDILLHIHNVQSVLRGVWVFPGFLPDGTVVPYPPAYYVLLAPAAWFFGGGQEAITLLLKSSAAILDSLVCLMLGFTAARLNRPRAGALAAVIYAVSPAPFELFSAGNYSNLFAQSVFSLTAIWMLSWLGRRAGEKPPWNRAPVVVFGLSLTMLGHYGMMLAALAVAVLYAAGLLLFGRRKSASREMSPVILPLLVSVALSFALYYRFFITEMAAQFGSILMQLSRPKSTGAGNIFQKLNGKVVRLVGVVPLVEAIFGGAARLQVEAAGSILLAAWLAASVAFMILDQTLGDAIRWYYLAAAPIALLGGRYAASLCRRGSLAATFALIAIGVAAWQLLYVWVGDSIFMRYHLR